MNVAVITSEGEVTNVIVGNDDDFLSKVRAWYLDVAYAHMETKEDAEKTPDPAVASLEEIADWWAGGEDIEDLDSYVTYFMGIQPNPLFEGVAQQDMLSELRLLRSQLMAEEVI